MNISGQVNTKPLRAVPKAIGDGNLVDAELTERERGNTAFNQGNFPLAIKSYTKCIGMKVKNYIAFSNRSMAYIKNKEFIRAEVNSFF